MPEPKDYDMDYRPKSYWYDDENDSRLSITVKGELRRQAAKELASEGIIDPVISVESLTEPQRNAAGAVHPWFMGGEYLPDLGSREVEIARVTLKSTTMDVISIRARRLKHRIAYRIVDEYWDEGPSGYHLIQKTSVRPLTLRRLIELIDNAQENGGLSGNARQSNYESTDDAEGLYDFATITSDFYHELEDWYDQSNQEWLDARLDEITGMTKEERTQEEYHERYLGGLQAQNRSEEEWREMNRESLEAEMQESRGNL